MKLSKTDEARADEITANLKKRSEELQTAVEVYNEAVRIAFDTLKETVETTNEAIVEANDFASGIASDLRSEWDEKSEKWQESEKGQDAQSFVEAWEGAEIEEIDIPDPDEVNLEDVIIYEDFEPLPFDSE